MQALPEVESFHELVQASSQRATLSQTCSIAEGVGLSSIEWACSHEMADSVFRGLLLRGEDCLEDCTSSPKRGFQFFLHILGFGLAGRPAAFATRPVTASLDLEFRGNCFYGLLLLCCQYQHPRCHRQATEYPAGYFLHLEHPTIR